MRREQFTIDVADVEWLEADREPELPTLTVTVEDGPDRDSFGRTSGEVAPGADEIDVTVRLSGGVEDPDDTAVVAFTDRVTGEYLLEANADASAILAFLAAARRYGEVSDDATRYRVRLGQDPDDPLFVLEKRTLLVYSNEGELLRGHSLIPSGVEI